MIKVGITGGIGSGKSVVAELLQLNGIPVYNADRESKKLINESFVIREKLVQLFGPNIYSSNGLNKPLLASYIFNDTNILTKVNHIIHPEVYLHFKEWTREQNKNCAIESAILFESGFDQFVDLRLMVYAPINLRIERAIKRDNTQKEKVLNRIQHQMPDQEKLSRCDFSIINDNQHSLIPQVTNFINKYLK